MPATATPRSRRDIDAVPLVRTRFTVTTTADAATVAVTGDLDLSSMARLQERLDEELALRPAALIIDLTAVGFCSSGGLSVLVNAVTSAHARGIACAVIANQRAVVRPIKLLSLDRILPIHADRADAQEWLSLVARLR
ncbi:STAS domain-containing protein [Amycolatopsis sp. CA-128772]|uniref:STAS domain-containing protein n=1 Tax=Amycolatopsis sp. CA-128772 TaxID=2073159 RepID=UPI000CCFFBDE|nr:STAS domain-containing protein [Amycolatopsis sp. CA-128772]